MREAIVRALGTAVGRGVFGLGGRVLGFGVIPPWLLLARLWPGARSRLDGLRLRTLVPLAPPSGGGARRPFAREIAERVRGAMIEELARRGEAPRSMPGSDG